MNSNIGKVFAYNARVYSSKVTSGIFPKTQTVHKVKSDKKNLLN